MHISSCFKLLNIGKYVIIDKFKVFYFKNRVGIVLRNVFGKLYDWFKGNFGKQHYNDGLINPTRESLKIAIYYGIVGSLWIILSDELLFWLVDDAEMYKNLQTYKGWFYIIITMIMVYVLIKTRMVLLHGALNRINCSYVELSTTFEKLLSTEEELRQQFDELEINRDALINVNQRYELVIEGSNDGIWEWDEKNQKYSFSIKNKDFLGYSVGEIEDSIEAWMSLLHPDDKEASKKKAEGLNLLNGGIYENTYRLRCKNGNYRWILSRGKAQYDRNGNIVRIAGSHTDITDQLNLRASLQREVILSENVMNNVSVIIATWDNKGRLLRFNAFAEKTFGYTEEEVLGQSILDLFALGDKRDESYETYQRMKARELISNFESRFLRKDGKCVDILWNSSILYEEDDQIVEMISVGTDITERKEMEKKLHSLAYKDTLTNLSNRVMFEDEICEIIKNRVNEKDKFALIYMDIDNFKHINDTLGHSSGDLLLIHVSEVLKSSLKNEEKVFRLGGDEFAVIFENFSSNDCLVDKLEGLIDKLRRPWIYENQEFFISFSIGIVIYPDHGLDYMTLLKNADTAMYSAKEKGKDNFCFYSKEMQAKTLEYIQTVNQLRYAIEKKEFMLYYQPQIELETGNITAVEALIRWKHPERGFISPLEFIPLAENTGQIHEITEWVTQTACSQKKEWENKGYPPINMSINFSGKCFTRVNLVKDFKALLDSMEINCNEIQIEITETAFMSDLQLVMNTVNQFREMGVKFALDDFGTGYSSLTYLKRLPIDILKMDRGFISNIKNQIDNQDEVIAKTVIQLAKALNIGVVAEGIETRDQLMFLKDNGCNEVQGYFFSRPVPGEEIEKLLKQKFTYKEIIEEVVFTYDKEA